MTEPTYSASASRSDASLASVPSDPGFAPRRHGGRRLAVVVLFAAMVIGISPSVAHTPVALKEGDYATESIMAEVGFPVVDLAATENARRRAANAAPYVYRVDETLVNEQLGKLAAVFAQVEEIAAKDVLSPEERARLIGISVRPQLSETTAALLVQPENLARLREQAVRLASRQLERGVFGDQPVLSTSVEVERADGRRVSFSREELPTVQTARQRLEEACREEAGDNALLASTLAELAGIAIGPTLVFDEVQTEALQAAARRQTPEVMRTISRNEMIVQAGHLVTQQDVVELLTYSRMLRSGSQGKNYLGHAVTVALILFCGIAFLRATHRKVMRSARQVWLLTLTVLLIVGVARLLLEFDVAPPYRMFVPIAACGVMLSVLVDGVLALGVVTLAALAVTQMPEFGSSFLVPAVVSTAIGVMTMRRVRKRGDFLLPGAVVGVTWAVLAVAVGLAQDSKPETLLTLAGVGLGNGLVVAIVLPGLLTPLEKLAGITTDITLLEYSDLKHPLLVRMQREAPGTFHHSLTMASLSEAAAEAIGGNPLLARIGCYFHDIGKMVQAEYFSENQNGGVNKHDLITPEMSAQILQAHVEEGLALGRKHGLTDSILAFIPEHQGTGIMIYFYKKAMEHAAPDAEIDENDFRYPGPKPQSRETAICMLADSVEAASRTLENPTPERLRAMVNRIVDNKFLDGQLDECDLTLRDLNRIGEAFTHVLTAMLHSRVQYPAEQTAEAIKSTRARHDSESQSAQGIAVPAPAENA